MTNDTDARSAALDALADFLLTQESDIRPEAIELLRPFLTTHDHLELCARIDICPMHYCDLEICADDEILDCAEYRN